MYDHQERGKGGVTQTEGGAGKREIPLCPLTVQAAVLLGIEMGWDAEERRKTARLSC